MQMEACGLETVPSQGVSTRCIVYVLYQPKRLLRLYFGFSPGKAMRVCLK